MEDSDVHGRETRKSDYWMSVHRLVAFMETVSHIFRATLMARRCLRFNNLRKTDALAR